MGSDRLLSLADIAALAVVQPAAVSNWRRRHSDFPQAEPTEAAILFHESEVLAWLSQRRIPSRDLAMGEPVGTTYGDRVRRHQRLAVSSPPPAGRSSPDRPGAQGDATVDGALWRMFERIRGSGFRPAGDMVLGLWYLRAMNHERWAELKAARRLENPDIARLFADAWGVDHDTPDWARRLMTETRLDQRSNAVVMVVIDALDEIWSRHVEMSDAIIPPPARVFSEMMELLADQEGIRGGEFFTPRTVVATLAALIDAAPGDSVYDPCSKSGDLLAGVADAIMRQGAAADQSSFVGQSLNSQSRQLAVMNLRLRGVEADLGPHAGNALHTDLHRTRHFDIVISNPPFNMNWKSGAEQVDSGWRYGAPPRSNANYAWLQHALAKLSARGRAALLMPTNASFSESSQEQQIRIGMLQDDVIDGVVALPPQLFTNTSIPATIWILDLDRRTRQDRVLFVDATELGSMVRRTRRALNAEEISRVATAFQRWRRGDGIDESGFAKLVPVDVILDRHANLNPRAYVDEARQHVEVQSIEEIVRSQQDRLARLATEAAEIDAQLTRRLAELMSWTP